MERQAWRQHEAAVESAISTGDSIHACVFWLASNIASLNCRSVACQMIFNALMCWTRQPLLTSGCHVSPDQLPPETFNRQLHCYMFLKASMFPKLARGQNPSFILQRGFLPHISASDQEKQIRIIKPKSCLLSQSISVLPQQITMPCLQCPFWARLVRKRGLTHVSPKHTKTMASKVQNNPPKHTVVLTTSRLAVMGRVGLLWKSLSMSVYQVKLSLC